MRTSRNSLRELRLLDIAGIIHSSVMAGLDPAIHEAIVQLFSWMTGPSPVMTVWCGRDMGFNCGIVGLPNVGKSALFNALTATQAAETTKYAFSTREPNIGRV